MGHLDAGVPEGEQLSRDRGAPGDPSLRPSALGPTLALGWRRRSNPVVWGRASAGGGRAVWGPSGPGSLLFLSSLDGSYHLLRRQLRGPSLAPQVAIETRQPQRGLRPRAVSPPGRSPPAPSVLNWGCRRSCGQLSSEAPPEVKSATKPLDSLTPRKGKGCEAPSLRPSPSSPFISSALPRRGAFSPAG